MVDKCAEKYFIKRQKSVCVDEVNENMYNCCMMCIIIKN